jgi:general stress protein 26
MPEKLELSHVADAMKGIDIAILSTHGDGDHIANRPMSNNGDVRYEGTSYFFSYEQAQCVSDIGKNPNVALGYSSEGGIFSSAVWIAVEGQARLIREKQAFKEHWTPDLDKWFEKGVDAPGLVLIEVKAERIKLWERNKEQELIL